MLMLLLLPLLLPLLILPLLLLLLRYGAEAAEAADRYAQALDAVKEREIAVLQLQKKIAEGEG